MKMLNLQDRDWKEFELSKIFEIKSTLSSIDRCKLNQKKGVLPYITRTDANNGICDFIATQNSYSLDKGNCITIGLDTQTAFYQKTPFYTGQNIQVLRSKLLNQHNAKFMLPLIKNVLSVFSWGGNGATLTRLKRSIILLPSTPKNMPAWNFMEQYIKERHTQLSNKYIEHIESQIPDYREIPSLEAKEWKVFLLSSICDIESGKDIYDGERIKGIVPYITSTASNNGVKYLVNNTNETLEADAISVNRNGSVGYCFYHKYKALYSNDCRKLRLKKHRNPYVSLFITHQISIQKNKYSYGYKMGTGRLKRQGILLPIDKNNNPDWEYIEQYSKNIIHKKYKEYLQFAK